MATKGWSFGALTDALKSSAFLDAGQAAGQVLLIAASNRAQVDGVTNVDTGFRAAGVEQNDVSLYSVGARAANSATARLAMNWYATNTTLEHVRGAGTDSLGFAMRYNGVKKLHYQPSGDRLVSSAKDLFSTGGLVLGSQSNADVTAAYSDWFRITARTATSFALIHTAKTWEFSAGGGIQVNTPLTVDANTGALDVAPNSGAWDSWSTINSAVHVRLTGAGASTGVKFQVPGTANVAAIQGAYSGGRGMLRLVSGSGPSYMLGGSGNSTHTFAGGGLTCDSNIVSAGTVYTGGGSGFVTSDGNVNGSAWGGYLSNWLNTNVMGDFGRGGQQYYQSTVNSNWESPAGCVLTGRNTNFNDGRQTGFYFRQLIGRKLGGAQFGVGDF